MSEWEEFCEDLGIPPHDPEAFDRVLDSWGLQNSSARTPLNVPLDGKRFATFKDAAEWSKQNGGAPFTRSLDGNHFVPCSTSNGRRARYDFTGLEGHETTKIVRAVFSRLSPHLLYRYSTAPSRFSEPAFLEDLRLLSLEEIAELNSLLDATIQDTVWRLANVEREAARMRRDPEQYALSKRQRWVSAMRHARSLCQMRLK
jgi:hypothetical protein